jgi:hypothetical protein
MFNAKHPEFNISYYTRNMFNQKNNLNVSDDNVYVEKVERYIISLFNYL